MCCEALRRLRWAAMHVRKLSSALARVAAVKMAAEMCVLVAALADDYKLFGVGVEGVDGTTKKQRREVERKCWVRPWIADRANDESNTLFQAPEGVGGEDYFLADDKGDDM